MQVPSLSFVLKLALLLEAQLINLARKEPREMQSATSDNGQTSSIFQINLVIFIALSTPPKGDGSSPRESARLQAGQPIG